MRLYRTPGGRWFGTQSGAGNACVDEAQPRSAWTEIDVPTDKPGLLDWLHLNCGPAVVEAFRAERELDRLREREAVARTTPAQPAPTPAPCRPSLTDVEAFIQSADAYQLRSLFENVVLRGRELVGEARP
ncbi:hypothetical protein [Rhizorhabdus histidinilytica]|uniref:hypothetical protein n=1 Tax=Rhizorhabdus histidinilytica TaxID=439228 RepID=UPI00322041A6